MTNENQLSREEILKRDQLLILANDRIGALFPRQPNVRAETFLRTSAFVPRLHDASACPRDHHETGLCDFAAEFDALLVLNPRRLRARRTENRHLPRLRVRRK